MTATQMTERRIVNELLGRVPVSRSGRGTHPWADRLIKGLAAAVLLLVVGSWSPGVLALGLGTATVWALGVR
jgi:hypothetical protein